MLFINDLGYAQIPLLAAALLGSSVAKMVRVIRLRSASEIRSTTLLPLHLHRWLSWMLCAVEFGLGTGLILTSGRYGRGAPAELVRFATGTLFLVATFALIEMHSVRPDIGCGCFGDLSTAPITGRSLARSALLAAAALGSTGVPPIRLPRTGGEAALALIVFLAELAAFGALSPEIGEVLVRIGYSAPCELRVLTAEQTLAALQRTSQWRKNAHLIADPRPADMWRELCWRYVVFSSSYAERDAQVVFAVYLEHRRPAVLSVLVDSATGAPLPWPAPAAVPAPLPGGWLARPLAGHSRPTSGISAGAATDSPSAGSVPGAAT